MKTGYLSALVLMSMVSFPLIAEESVPKKTLAIVYEEGKTPEALFHKSFEYFNKLRETGELKSAELGTAKIFGEVIDIQTPTDSSTAAQYERDAALSAVRNSIQAANVPYSARFSILSTNHLFGDKSLGYVINPYRGCYDHDYLAKGLEKTGFKVVDASEKPDITMTIGIDMCMSENEFKEYIQKNTSLKVTNSNTQTENHSTSSSIGNDLMRSGSNAQLATPSGGGNAGIAVAGVGLALNIVNWLATKSPQEKDMIRYHVKFEGKDKKPLEFYPMIITKNTHKAGDAVYISARNEAEQFLFASFMGWNLDNNGFTEKLQPIFLEKDILKMTEMIVALKNNQTKETNQ